MARSLKQSTTCRSVIVACRISAILRRNNSVTLRIHLQRSAAYAKRGAGLMSWAASGGVGAVVLGVLLSSCQRSKQVPPVVAELTARPQQYSSTRIRTRIVDDRTGEPVEGAVVLALWRKIDTYRLTFGGVYAQYETITDRRGMVEIPRWGPRTLNYDYYLDARDPEIWVMKRGYLVGYFDNTGALDPRVFNAGGIQSPLGISKLPPRLSQLDGERYARAANGGSIWHDRPVPLRRASSPEAEARALAAVTPLEQHELTRVEMSRFWAEWTAARDALPVELRDQLEAPPLPRSHRSVVLQ